MKELFMLMRERLLKNGNLVLVTVTGSTGSTPRGAGARMLVEKGKDSEGTRLWGTIGGGITEHLAIEEAALLLHQMPQPAGGERYTPRVAFKKYTLHPNDAAVIGAACGGEVSIFFRSLDPEEPGLLEVIEKGISSFSGDSTVWFIMEVTEDENSAVNFTLGIAGEEGFLITTGPGDAPDISGSLLKPGPLTMEAGGKRWLSEPLVPGGFVYVFGGGHVAQELVPLLSHVGFRCAVFDDRKEFASQELFPAAEKIILGDFEHIGESITLTGRDYAVIVSRGHLWDLEAWAFALNSSAVYIGIIGSRAKHTLVKERLRERGFRAEEINAERVHTPIGIDIKSETPAEIAVSIAAELILKRAEILRA